jgi:Uma2 family endonuclease
MAITVKRLTVDDLDAMPEEHEGDRHELIDGELVVSPPPGLRHQTVSSNVVFALELHVRATNAGRVSTAPTGIQLAPDNVLIPDACFVAADRVPATASKYLSEPPDLVVEILSPRTRRRDQGAKRELYARFGVREYWIVDPTARRITILSLAGNRYASLPLSADGAIQSRVLPGLRLHLEEVFAGI